MESGLLGPVRLVVTEKVQPAVTAGDKGPLPVKVQLEFQPGHPWLPPFGLDRVGRPLHAVVTGDGQQPAAGEFVLVGFRDGKEVSRNRLTWVVKTKQVWDPLPVPCYARVALDARPSEVVLLFKATPEAAPVELARRKVPFEAEAIAKPDKTINPVDLGTVLVPADWLLLAGRAEGQRGGGGREPQRRAAGRSCYGMVRIGPAAESGRANSAGTRSQGPSYPGIGAVFADVGAGRAPRKHRGGRRPELWQKQIRTMIVPKPPAWPAFGAVQTKLRYDAPIVSFAEGNALG